MNKLDYFLVALTAVCVVIIALIHEAVKPLPLHRRFWVALRR